MDKLKKRKKDSGAAQQILNDDASQKQYIEMLTGIKQDMYNKDEEPKEESIEPSAEPVETQAEKLQDMIESTRNRKGGGELKRIPIESDLAEVYKMIAVREGVTLSGLVSNVLETYLDKHLKEVKKLLKPDNKFLV